ncbi:hypothetical protein OIU92_01090 [Escherichia coli]|nr:hypothetical protein [Escherichia coli]
MLFSVLQKDGTSRKQGCQAGTAKTTQHKVAVPGASRCLAKVAHQAVGIHRRSTVSLNLNPRTLSRIHHNAKDLSG